MTNREASLRKIVVILEEQMTSMGLSEEEKNAKTGELVAFVSAAEELHLASRVHQDGMSIST